MKRDKLRLLVVGTSNSVMKDGWISVADPAVFEIENRSFGNSTSFLGVLQLIRHLRSGEFDYGIFDFCVNDQTYYEKGLLSISQVELAIEEIVARCRAAMVTPVFLLLPRRSDIGSADTAVVSTYRRVLERLGVVSFDATMAYAPLVESFGTETVFLDEAHATPAAAGSMAEILFDAIERHSFMVPTRAVLAAEGVGVGSYVVHDCTESAVGRVEVFRSSYFESTYVADLESVRPGVVGELLGVFALTKHKRSAMSVDGQRIEIFNPGVPDNGKGFFCYTNLPEPVPLHLNTVITTRGEAAGVQPAMLLIRSKDVDVPRPVSETLKDSVWNELLQRGVARFVADLRRQRAMGSRWLAGCVQIPQLLEVVASQIENKQFVAALGLVDQAIAVRGRKPRLLIERVRLLRALGRDCSEDLRHLASNFPNNPLVERFLSTAV